MRLAHVRRGSGEPLVLVHGIGSFARAWDPVAGLLAVERDVIAVDLPGFGATPPLPGQPSLERLVGAVASFLDELGIERAHMAGNSMGGGIALELARAGRALSATALSPIGFWTREEWRATRRVLRTTARAARLTDPVAGGLLWNPLLRAAGMSHLMSRPWALPGDAAVAATRALARAPSFDAMLDALGDWSFPGAEGIGCPVTIAWAQRDRVLPPVQAQRARRELPDAEHLMLTGCGHVPMADDPGQVARVLAEGSGARPRRGPARRRAPVPA
jgi:pimeloyl-ACP methyl ester carboxylesterase